MRFSPSNNFRRPTQESGPTSLAGVDVKRIVRSHRRTVALIIAPDATLTIRAPWRVPLKFIEEFVAEKSSWIAKKIGEVSRRPQARSKEFVEGESFLFLGQAYPLKFTAAGAISLTDSLLLPRTFQVAARARLASWYRREARRLITQRVRLYSLALGDHPRSVRLTSPRHRWGSCGPNSTLNFNWRLIMAPLPVLDYVVVHEISHLQIKNHSRRFWNRVAKSYPNWREARSWLHRNGDRLMKEFADESRLT